jgi:hypothetical protein
VVFTWRRQARTAERVVPCFAPVQIAAAVETGEENSKPPSEDDRRMRQLPAARNGLIEIDLHTQCGLSWLQAVTDRLAAPYAGARLLCHAYSNAKMRSSLFATLPERTFHPAMRFRR